MAARKILLPYNFTTQDEKALEFVIDTFGGRRDTEVTLFFAYTPAPEIPTADSAVMSRVKGNLNYLSKSIMDQESNLKAVRNQLIERGFDADRVRYLFRPHKKDIASEIIDLATGERFDVVILNHKPGQITRFFKGSIFNKVISGLKGIAVCVVS